MLYVLIKLIPMCNLWKS